MDLDFRPDMGGMNGRWRSIARTQCSPASRRRRRALAIVASLVETCKLCSVDPYAFSPKPSQRSSTAISTARSTTFSHGPTHHYPPRLPLCARMESFVR